MKKTTYIATLLLAFGLASGIAQNDSTSVTSEELEQYRQVNDYVNENETCFKCHGESKYTLVDEIFGREITQSVCEDKRVDREAYYSMVHQSFACLDCHAYEYEEFPHPMTARLEQPYACIDCHGYDEDYAQYHFEDIETQFMESVHFEANPEEFSCWKCHDPHSYQTTVRPSGDGQTMTEAIAYNNDICLSCHSDFDRFQLLTERGELNIIETHEWLPNQAAHFSSVRCIECHTEISDSVLVAHKVLPMEQAVRKCTECHSQNSMLMATLYKHQAKENRSKYGFVNGVLLNEAYVIGANRNQFLVWTGIILFILTLAGIAVHTVARIIYKK